MKISTKKILLWSFWPILAILIIVLYFILPKGPENQHVKYVPENSNFVVVINSWSLVLKYINTLENNPVVFKDIELFGEDEDVEPPKFGIDPISKIALFEYENVGFSGYGVVLHLLDFQDFISFVNLKDGGGEEVAYSDVNYVLFQEDNRAFVKYGEIGMLVAVTNTKITNGMVEEVIDQMLSTENNLLATSDSFKKALDGEDQFLYWSKENSNLADKVNPQLGLLNSLFDQKVIKSNLTKDGFVLKAYLKMAHEEDIIIREATNLELQGSECFRFGASLNPDKFKGLFDVVVPSSKLFLLDNWNGGVSAAIDGFQDVEIHKVTIEDTSSKIDPLYPFKADTTEVISLPIPGGLNSNFSFPMFNVAFELNDVEATKLKITEDPSISNVGEYYAFDMPEYLLTTKESDGSLFGSTNITRVQKVYFYFVENSIVFCPILPDEDFIPNYCTFGVNFHFDPMIDSYINKGFMDDIAMSTIDDLKMKGFIVNYTGIEEGKLVLEGDFKLNGDEDHLVEFPKFVGRFVESPAMMIFPMILSN